ncbi:hypothetical protein DCC85_16670 [Paenibacillus sp. CAA11]|uniref:hypothetical protein n=1 Tax=Paenibacillus sp. CAA11 TaxID=1532905 RepID=UPI000D3A7AAB|nr:hypothetical protein [Paenibacillus sp. CAA11]AWB45671.1 hypothetical protein DCC85_16670 [Paenibacillus sp. CAA11]
MTKRKIALYRFCNGDQPAEQTRTLKLAFGQGFNLRFFQPTQQDLRRNRSLGNSQDVLDFIIDFNY